MNNDPKGGNGYGCFVEIEGTRNGKRVKYLMAHLQQGSIGVIKGENVEVGSYLGRVGNTGRASDREKGGVTNWYEGKKSGHHLHLEIREWDGSKWVLQDPKKYLTDEPISKTTSTAQPQGDGQGTPVQGQPEQEQRGDEAQQYQQGDPVAQSLMPVPLTGVQNAPIPQQPAPQMAEQPQPQETHANAGGGLMDTVANVWNAINPFSATPAAAEEMPTTQEQPLNHAGVPYVWHNPSTGAGYTQSQYDDLAHMVEMGRYPNIGNSREDVDNYIASQGMQRVGTATPTTPETATPAPSTATRPDPDSGLGRYRAEDDNTPVTWRNKNGNPMRISDGQLFTQGIYEDWKRKADAGHFKDVGVNNAEDLNKWLEKIGMRPDRPSEQRGVNSLNGNSSANSNLPSENEDENITPFNITPSNSPERFPAPEFTDEINDTTPEATQDLLDGLNGITDSRYRRWTNALRRFYPSTTPSPQINVPNSSSSWANRYGDSSQAPARLPTYTPSRVEASPQPVSQRTAQPVPQRPAVQRQAPQRPAPKPRAGYTNYEQQRTHVDGAAKRHGVDSALIRAIIETESSWRPRATGAMTKWGQAKDLMQLMPATARKMGIRDPYDPAQNIEGGTKYIAQLIRQFGGNVSKALMAYNCGADNVKKGRIPAASRRYAQKVLGIYRRIKGQ